ncbi:DUF2285 domain-containing protein [Mesorhizobium australicum]|uniref:T6SS Transcription factor RovC-like DNA binding domain-containing protein n=1 Tax=Mesorhizobium australicum TaxID=536018 RepID=A0A1X7NSM4_9HYPH|nr:DUF2285 domain-containing protein [Mesorhizobium australicum]SMH40572.1 hypothetical protein SAMN02982922_2362 [Mesorhizobium australicum]
MPWIAGASAFAARPDQAASQQPIFWTPETDPGVINLVQTPKPLTAAAASGIDVPFVALRRNGMGLHTRVPLPGGSQLMLVHGTHPDRPLAVIIPLDSAARDRLSAVERFVRSQSGHSVRDTRLTAAQRRRLAQMLRALDGRREGASYLQLAIALFGRRLIDPANWQESSFRYTTLRLVRDGLMMVDGGYRQLLRARRST